MILPYTVYALAGQERGSFSCVVSFQELAIYGANPQAIFFHDHVSTVCVDFLYYVRSIPLLGEFAFRLVCHDDRPT